MNVYYDEGHSKHRPLKELDAGLMIENADKPERVTVIMKRLLEEGFNIKKPGYYGISYVFLVHDAEYVKWLGTKSKSINQREYFPEVFGYDRIFDTGTPVTRECFEAAKGSVNVVLGAADDLLMGERIVYALCRPPGHHASVSMGGGYCYFNNAAIAARYLQSKCGCNIAILDLDFHHGNGTQEIFYEDETVLYVSVHGDPEIFYPWITGRENEIGRNKGIGYNFNFPLPGETDGDSYLKTLTFAINEINRFRPVFLLVSLGLDTHCDDPVGHFSLTDEVYSDIGRLLKAINLPTLIIQEGGYNSSKNPAAVIAFLKGIL